MSRVRTFSLATSLLVITSAFAACSDGEPNDPKGSGGGGGADGGTDGSDGGSGDCPTGLTLCGGQCVNTEIDPSHCGACDEACTDQVCNAGACEDSPCPGGQVKCGDECVTLASNRDHCGECGETCGSGQLCSQGQCAESCGASQLACGSSCVDPLTDPDYCGATTCDDAGAGGASGSGAECAATEACVVGECREFIRVWNEGERVDTRATAVGAEQSIGVDAQGNALMIWRQQLTNGDDTSFRVYASYFDASTKTWSEQVRIDNDNVRVRNLKLAVAPNGDAIAVWIAGPVGEDAPVKSAIFNGTAKTWSSPTRLDTHDEPADTPDVAIDGNGDGVVVWSQFEAGNDYRIYSRRYVDGDFEEEEALPTQGAGQAQFPQVAVNDAGSIALVWEEYDGDNDVWMPLVSRYSSGWTAPEDLRTDPVSWGRNPDVGMDDTGNITVVFGQDDLTDVRIMESHFEGGPNWSTAVAIDALDDADVLATDPIIAIDRDGLATVVFQAAAYDGAFNVNDFSDIYAVRRGAEGDWGAQVLLGDLPAQTFGDISGVGARTRPYVRVDDQGNAFAFWLRGTDVWTSRFDIVSGTWVGPETLQSADATSVSSPDIAVSSGGNAFASWVQAISGGAQHIYVSRFD